jgi:MFS family permease
MTQRIFDLLRFKTIISAFVAGGLQHLTAFVIVIPLCFLLLGRYRDPFGRRGNLLLPGSVLGLMLAGYIGVYLTTPHDLDWHLATSLDRLLVQVWPMAVVAVFLQLGATVRDAPCHTR